MADDRQAYLDLLKQNTAPAEKVKLDTENSPMDRWIAQVGKEPAVLPEPAWWSIKDRASERTQAMINEAEHPAIKAAIERANKRSW